MLGFKEVTIADRAVLEGFLTRSGRMHSDYSFAVMICWSHVFKTYWCIAGGMLLMKTVSLKDGQCGYFQPVGEGDFMHLMPFLEEDAALHGQPFIMYSMTPDGVSLLRKTYPQWGFASARKYADYIYNARDLRELHGKKYQAKRNHISRFESSFQFRYAELAPSMFPECMSLELAWESARTSTRESAAQPELQEEFAAEENVIRKAFEHWDELGFIGGAIYVGDRMAAFCFGSPVNDRVFCTHIEKADVSYEGAFAVINQQFAKHLPPQYELIDREDDLGLEGLRHAKMQYHPCLMSPRLFGRALSPLELQVRDLWLECFPCDTIDDADTFILTKLDSSRMLSRFEDGRLVSMLHIVPFGDVAYLYAVATATSRRGRGYASLLCREAVERCRHEGFRSAALIPSSESLRAWYGTMGFAGSTPMRFVDSDGYDYGTGDPSADLAMSLDLEPECGMQFMEAGARQLAETL